MRTRLPFLDQSGTLAILCESSGVTSLDENPNCAKTYASFRLIGDALDIDVVTRALNREPDLALTKGQEFPLVSAVSLAVS